MRISDWSSDVCSSDLLLHAGRYAYHPLSVSASRLKSPINPFTPRALSARGVERQIDAFATAARLAREGGYDGVEVMGSEGYLLNQFTVARTNKRDHRWGGSAENRMRFAVEIVRRVREACGPDRSEEHTSELQSLMRTSYAVFCL